MRFTCRALLVALSLGLAGPAAAQAVLGGTNLNNNPPVNSIGNESQYYIDWASGRVYGPKTLGVWPLPYITTLSTSTTGPFGPAGGVLTGTYPNPTFATSAAVGSQFLTGTSAGAFTRAQPAIADISGLGTGTATALSNAAGGAGGFALVGTTPPTGAAGGDLTGTYPNPTLAAVLVAGGPIGSATVAPIITYDAKGRLTVVSSATITPAIGSITGLGTGIATALGVNIGSAGAPVLFIASGAQALTTTAIASGACTAAQTATATGVATTDVVSASFNGDPTAVTGYIPSTGGMLTIIAYPTLNTVNFKVCNNTTASITPGAVTINWRVTR